MKHPEYSRGFAASLSLVPWHVFGTLTFKNPMPIERRRWRLLWRHLHEAAQSLGTPYGKLLIAVRAEHGELGDRPHFHYLLGRTGTSNLHALCHWLGWSWSKLCQGHGEVRIYDPHLAGADYIEKCLGGGNSYELGKFNKADRLELSASVYQYVRWSLRSVCNYSSRQVVVKTRATMSDLRLAIESADNPLPSPA